MDDGHVPDDDEGSDAYDEYTTEAYAELFAFMSLIAPGERTRADYGRRARDLLMAVMDEAERGQAATTTSASATRTSRPATARAGTARRSR